MKTPDTLGLFHRDALLPWPKAWRDFDRAPDHNIQGSADPLRVHWLGLDSLSALLALAPMKIFYD
jgi:hypothetical protein